MTTNQLILTEFDLDRKDELTDRLAALTGKSHDQINAALASLPLRLASNIDPARAERLRDFLAEVGAHIDLTRSPGIDRPADNDLMPRMSFGQKLGLGWRMFRQYGLRMTGFGFLAGLFALALLTAGGFALAMASGGISLMPLMMLVSAGRNGPPDMALIQSVLNSSGALVAFAVVAFAVMALWSHWIQLILVRLPYDHFRHGGKASIWRAAKTTLPYTINAVIAISVLVLAQLAFMAAGAFLAQQGKAAALSPVMLQGVSMAFMAVYLFISVILMLYGPAIAVEGLGAMAALKRAWRLSKGRRLRLFGGMLLTLLLVMLAVVAAVSAMVVAIQAAGLSGRQMISGFDPVALAIVMGFILALSIVWVFMAIMVSSVLDAYYFESRVLGDQWKPAWRSSPVDGWPMRPKGEDAMRPASKFNWITALLLLALTAGGGFYGTKVAGEKLAAGAMQDFSRVKGLADSAKSDMRGANPIEEQKKQQKSTRLAASDAPNQYLGGPISLDFSRGHFFKDKSPYVWVILKADGLPEGSVVKVKTVRVADVSGSDVSDHDSPFMNDMPVPMNWKKGVADGIHTAYLKAGVKESDLKQGEYHVDLKLPTAMRELKLGVDDVGKVKALFDMGVELASIKDNAVELRLKGGNFRRVTDYRGYFQGKPVKRRSRTSISSSDNADISLKFEQPVDEVGVVMTRSFDEESLTVRLPMDKDKQRVTLVVNGENKNKLPTAQQGTPGGEVISASITH